MWSNNILFILGVLIPELLICLVQLEILFPGLIHESHLIPMLSKLLDYLDKFNRLAPGLDKENAADLLWQGVPSKCFSSIFHHLLLSMLLMIFFFFINAIEIDKYISFSFS